MLNVRQNHGVKMGLFNATRGLSFSCPGIKSESGIKRNNSMLSLLSFRSYSVGSNNNHYPYASSATTGNRVSGTKFEDYDISSSSTSDSARAAFQSSHGSTMHPPSFHSYSPGYYGGGGGGGNSNNMMRMGNQNINPVDGLNPVSDSGDSTQFRAKRPSYRLFRPHESPSKGYAILITYEDKLKSLFIEMAHQNGEKQEVWSPNDPQFDWQSKISVKLRFSEIGQLLQICEHSNPKDLTLDHQFERDDMKILSFIRFTKSDIGELTINITRQVGDTETAIHEAIFNSHETLLLKEFLKGCAHKCFGF